MTRNFKEKALYEYGKAFGMMIIMNAYLRGMLKGKGYRLITGLLHQQRDARQSFVEAICDAWRKRSVCRKRCNECIYCDWRFTGQFMAPQNPMCIYWEKEKGEMGYIIHNMKTAIACPHFKSKKKS